MAALSTRADACAWVGQRGKEDFGKLWDHLEPLCFNEHGWPSGVNHVDHFDSLSKPSLAANVHEDLVIAYVYLAASFFCLDHLFDKESRNDDEILAGSVLVPKALERIGRALVASGLDGLAAMGEASTLFQRFTEAMLLEREVRERPEVREEAIERSHVVGRSWLVIFMYRTIQLIKGQPVDPEAQKLLEDTIYILQLGDDWGDWREDFRNGNLTSFIRECITEIGRLPANEDELERFVYLSGFYEKRGAYVTGSLLEVEKRIFEKYGTTSISILTMVRQCRELSAAVVENFGRVKDGLPALPLPAPLH